MNKNTKYWAKRFALIEDTIHKKVKLSETEIANLSKKIKNAFKKDISYWLYKFAENNSLTMAAAKEQLNNEDFQDFQYTVNDYIEMGRELNVDKKWLEIMINMSAKHHITKYAVAQLVLRNYVEQFIASEAPIIVNTILEAYKESMYMSTFELVKGVKVDLTLFEPDTKKLDLLLKKPWTSDGITFSERVWGTHRAELVGSLQNILEESLIKGENPIRASKQLVDKFGVTKKQAQNLLQTESAYFSELAKHETFKELGIKKYVYVATLDYKTSDTCRELDGKMFDISEKEVGKNCPPMHCRCRSTTAPYSVDLKDVGERAARDENGKTVMVPIDMTYKEFHKEFIESNPKYELKEKMWRNRHYDKKQHEAMRKNLGKNIPRSFDDFQYLKYKNGSKFKELHEQYRKVVK